MAEFGQRWPIVKEAVTQAWGLWHFTSRKQDIQASNQYQQYINKL